MHNSGGKEGYNNSNFYIFFFFLLFILLNGIFNEPQKHSVTLVDKKSEEFG